MEARLDGRAALITGGSRGLGRAMALEFARSGADVAIIARRADVVAETVAEIKKESKGKVFGYAGDIAKADDIKRIFDQTVKDLGRVDIVVNNAGTSMAKPFETVSDDDWYADLELKLFGAIRMIRLALPGMKERRWGRIVNIVNTGGKTPRGGSAPTTVSRAAGIALTKVLSQECAPHNILVNALCTGLIITDQTEKITQSRAPGLPLHEALVVLGKTIPLGRLGTAEEYANVACFLCSDANGYVTGTAINIDGGASPVT
jgi:NAD(P)-dependent dehydrogenase (short-subunit alcohol dehydrogenase family)